MDFIVDKLCDGWGGATTLGALTAIGVFTCGEPDVLGIGVVATVVDVVPVGVTTVDLTS